MHIVMAPMGRVVDVLHEERTTEFQVVNGRQLCRFLVGAKHEHLRPLAVVRRGTQRRPAPADGRKAVRDVSEPVLSCLSLRLSYPASAFACRTTLRARLLEELRDAALPNVHELLDGDGRALLDLAEAVSG